ncbi:erythromycin esterase [Myxococcus stipitatus DSM 14675]|uniref:Erythromycin esterase n=2 Tax=Myxococcus stipitatus TaxID=83455 RepID=L7U9H1_MYXSD|nr:erythromycin esterase [Myxococcus stipitatus DSM 14675]
MKAFRILWLVFPLACASTGTPQVVLPPEPPVQAAPPSVTTAAVEGRVEGDAKSPVEGAVVSLVPARKEWNPNKEPPAGRMLTGPDGRFRFEGLSPGEYGLTVSAPRHEATFILDVQLTAGASALQRDVVLQPATRVVRGRLKTDVGGPVADAWVQVIRKSEFLADVLYVRADAQGQFEVSLPIGRYTVKAPERGSMLADNQFDVRAEDSARDVNLTLLPRPETSPAAPEVVSWVKQSLVPLTTVEAGHGFADLQPLKPWLAKARVVALGEATHGTREFFQLKHRLMEFLVTELGFNIFALEGNFSEALVINDYVLHGKGDEAQVLDNLFPIWRTEEVMALIRWMRAYNADPRHTHKLKFYGVDMQDTVRPTRALLDFFARVDPAFHQRLVGPMARFLDVKTSKAWSEENGKGLASLVADIEARLRQRPRRKRSEKELAVMARHARVLAQWATQTTPQVSEVSFMNHRDRAMAENARWVLEQEGADARMVLWAHNGHVSTAKLTDFVSMGQHLREVLGDALYSFGFAFNQGTLRAVHESILVARKPRVYTAHAVPPAEVGAVDGTLARAQVPLFALDLRGLPTQGAARDFFTQTRAWRNYGFVFSENAGLAPTRSAKEFDGLFFVDYTSAAIAMPERPPPEGNASAPSP